MKSKLAKIMGGVLTAVLVFTLGAAFMPTNTPGGPDVAEAGDLGWSTITIPTGTGSVLVAADENLGPVAISPTYSTDKTVWASVVDTVTPAFPMVYKSTNGGHTWSGTTTQLGAAAGDVVVDLVPSPQYATDSTIFVATQTPAGGVNTGRVYRSINGGSSFGQLGVVTMVAGEVITCFDVAPDYDGTGVLAIGIANIAANTFATAAVCVQQWGANGVLSWVGIASAVAADVSALMYSPNYSIDTTILCVTSDGAAGQATTNPYLRAIVGGVWDSGIAATQVNNNAANGMLTDYTNVAGGQGTSILEADIALPKDYNGQVSTTRRAYVTVVSDNATTPGGTDEGNIYRITNITAGTDITGSITQQFSQLQYRGDFSSGTLLATLYGSAVATQSDVYRTTNPTDSVVNWYGVSGAANMPTGTCGAAVGPTGYIAATTTYETDTTVVVGTSGNGSAFGVSTNGAVSFNETGLIDNGGAGGAGNELLLGTVSDIDLSPNYGSDSLMFMVTENDDGSANDTNAWVRTAAGLWERLFAANFNTAGTGVIACSDEFKSDSVLYIGDIGATPIYYSATAGQVWSARAVAAALGCTIQTIAAPDASTVYVGDAAGAANVAKSTNSGWTWPSALMKNTGATPPVASLKVKDSSIVVGGSNGTVRRSDDGGATWAQVSGGLTAAAAVYVDFDGTTVYAVEAGTGAVYRSEAGAAWRQIGAATTTGLAAALDPAVDAIELVLADDGTLYYAEPTGQDVRRSINPEAALPTPDATFQQFAALPVSNIAAMSVVAGSSNHIAICNAAGGVRLYTDTLSKGTEGPDLASPADGSTLTRGTATRLSIAAGMTNVTAYEVQWTTDSGFASAVTSVAIAAPSLQTAAQTLTEGATIYWRARATTPLNSPWSETWTVVTQVVTAVVAPTIVYPGGLAGSTVDLPLDIVFNWGAFKYADGYEFQLASDAAMSDLLVDLTGANALGNINSYQSTAPLAYSTTYYWRVRALKAGSAWSDWSAVTGFTTMDEPKEPTPPVVIEEAPPAPTPTTPAYIWAIIAIGAVLVIVVIVLIARTRRMV